MKIALGSDHGGFELKEGIKAFLSSRGYDVVDVGTNSSDSCHYPEFALKCANLVKDGECQFGVIVCTTGEGIAMVANKVSGIRAGIGYNDEVAQLMREHNDANIITFGAKYTTLDDALRRILIFLNAEFQGGRHAKRVEMIKKLDK